MISIDEVFEENEKHQYVTDKIIDDDLGKEIWVDRGMFNNIGLSYPVIYNAGIKKFIPGNNLTNKNNAFLGWFLGYDEKTHMVDVLYRGFLFNEPIKIPVTLQQQYMQSYISGQFKIACDTIIENMPRIKKLKRLNLKMITKTHALFIYRNLDRIIKQYEIVYGYEKAMLLKAQITTSPFYVNDNGTIKIYDIQTNELTMPDLEVTAYFLAYFTFLNKH